MKRIFKFNIIILLTVLTFILNFPCIAVAATPSQDAPEIKCATYMLVDAESGRILSQKNPDEKLHPASMTKMMTEYLVLQSIKEGKINWDQKVSISDYTYKISQNNKLSNVPLRKEYQYTVRELYESMAIYSANGSTIALAELIGGSEANFVKMMNDKAVQLDLKDYKFVNCTGLNNSDLLGLQPTGAADEENVMSARATLTLAYRLLHDYPQVLETASIPQKIFREGTSDAIRMDNWNFMLPALIYGYKGIDRLKTGSTDLGGYSFTATAKRGEMRLLSVVMKTSSISERFAETKKLLDYGFSNYSSKQLYTVGYKIPSQPTVTVVKGKQKKVEVETTKPLTVVVKNGEENLFEPAYKINPSMADKNGELIAPFEKGKAIGYLMVDYKGNDKLGYLTTDGVEKVEIATSTGVKKAFWITLMFRSINNFFINLFKK